jgi:serine/threonine protein kinase
MASSEGVAVARDEAMSTVNHQKAGEIFNEALDLPAGQRPNFVSHECGPDAELRAEVESLLASHHEEFLEENVRERVLELIRGSLLPGDLISERYRIVEMIGSGGMGEVYLAEDTNISGRKVALKVVAEKFSQDRKQVRNFENEARTVSQLNHPNILTVHDFVYVDDTSFIVTEFIEGETLRKKLQAGPLELSTALKISRQIASALAAAHAKGIVHRDIKPENVIVNDSGHVKVLDFGIAKLAEGRTPDDELDRTGTSHEETASGFGTANYMSPEQVRGQDVDARTDIWSLGVCLHETLTGTPPFKGEKPIDTFASILKDEPPPVGPEIPESLKAIIKKALRKNRDKRYQAMREFAYELERSPETAHIAVDPFNEWRKTSGAKIWALLLACAALSCVLAAVLALSIYSLAPWTVEHAARSAQAVASGFHLIVLTIAYWYFRRNPGPQGFRRLKYDKADHRLKPHIVYSTGYEKVSDWKRAREIAKDALKHYRDAFSWLLFAWLVLYSVTWFSLVEEDLIVASVLTLANNFNTLCIAWCFAILNDPITTEDKTQNKKAIRVKEGRKWPASLVPAIIAMIFLSVVELWLVSRVPQYQERIHYGFRVISGLAGGVAMALFVGRFQSKFLNSPSWLVFILFLYTVIQALFIFYGGALPGELAGAAVVMNAALVLKCLLILYMFWLFQSGRLLFYLVRVRRATTQVDSEWQNFREVLQQKS